MNIGCLILSGGKSTRMGREKAMLHIGAVRFLDKLVYEFSSFSEILISVDKKGRHPQIHYPMVEDVWENAGPLGGLLSGLLKTRADALFVLPCDVPLFSMSLAKKLMTMLSEDVDCVISKTEDGRWQPFCGIYKKSCIPVLKEAIACGQLKMMNSVEKLRHRVFFAGEESWRYQNVNTPADYQTLHQPQHIIAISGYKNSGKTTLIEHLIPLLLERGIRVMTVKHDGHSYIPDVPGTDSYRFFMAGAKTSLIFDSEKFSVTTREGLSRQNLATFARDVDLILLEGFKWTNYKKIEVVRRATKREPIAQLTNRLAFVSDWSKEELSAKEEEVFLPNDIESIADFITREYKMGHLEEEDIKL